MTNSWLKAIQSVPWSDVINNAPKVAEGAKGLWDRVAKKAGIDAAADSVAPTQDITPPTELGQVYADLMLLNKRQKQLELQLVSATELINSLAQQNQNLVQRLDRLQSRMRWLLTAALVCLVLACLAWLRIDITGLVGRG